MDSTPIHLLLASSMIAFGAWRFGVAVRRGMRLDLFVVAVMGYTFFIGASTWVAFLYRDFELPDIPVDTLLTSYAVTFFFLFGMLLIRKSGIAGRYVARNYPCELVASVHTMPALVYLFWLAIWMVRYYMASQYALFFSGSFSAQKVLSMPSWLRAVDSMGNGLAFGLFIWAVSYQVKRRWTGIFPWIIIGSEALWMFVRGRRWTFLLFEAAVLVLLLHSRRIRLGSLVWGVTLLLTLTFFVFPLFKVTRHLEGQLRGQIASPIDRFAEALEESADKVAQNDPLVNELHVQSMQERTLVLCFVWAIAEDMKTQDLMYGKALGRDIIHVFRHLIPSFVFDYQREMASVPQSEQLIQRHFGQPEYDTLGIWPAVALADFGILGGFFYGMLFGAILIIFEALIVSSLDGAPLLAALIMGSGYYAAALTDAGPDTILIALRSVVVLWLILWPLRKMLPLG